MTIIVFLIDTSASMNQRAYLGGRPTLLDVAKGAVETFVKVRQRSLESRGDRYMLLTFEEPPANIKAGWKENLATFMNELKNLQCLGMTTMGAALKHAFDVLNINRMQTGIDTYGQGRCPFYLEPSVIVVITDGGKLSSNAGVQDDFNLPMNCPIPGSELTREPFRWDQRLFSLVLRLSGTPAVERDTGLVPSDSSPIDAMCEVTGGRSYCITSHRMLMQCIDSLVQKVQSGVVINFEKVGPDPPALETTGREGNETGAVDDGLNNEDKQNESYDSEMDKNGTRWNGGGNHFPIGTPAAWHSCRRLIYVPRTIAQKGFAVGFWPIPESFRPDPNAPTLPPRTAHPAVKFTCTSQEPMVIDNLPFDKYELEPSPLTQFILARKQPTICWQVFVANSSKGSEMGQPFGYLKASTNLTCVNLFVMPYNYPVLLPLLDELFKIHRCKPPPEWKMAFQQYIDRMPSYYVSPLKRALTKMGAPTLLMQNLVPDTQDNSLSYSVHNYLKRLKNQAKMDFDKLCNEVLNKSATAVGAASLGVSRAADGVRVVPRSPLKRDVTGHPCLQDKFVALRDQLNEFGGFVIGLPKSGGAAGRRPLGARAYRNPFDVRRRDLLDQVVRMRANLLAGAARTRLLDEDSLHCMPVAQMGNYQEYLKRQAPPLREIESPPVRQHMFGNPFKIDKRMMVDEADMDAPAVGTGNNTAGSGAASNASGTPRSAAGGASRRPTTPLLPGPPPLKRKPGPLPAHITARRPSSPAPFLSPVANPPPHLLLLPVPPISAVPTLAAAEAVPGRPPEVQDSSYNDVLIPTLPEPRIVPHVVPSIYQPPPPPQPSQPALVTYNHSTSEPKPLVNGDAYPTIHIRISPPPSPPPILPSVNNLPIIAPPQALLPPIHTTPPQAPVPSHPSHPSPAPQPDVQQQISMILHEAALAPRPLRTGNTPAITYHTMITSTPTSFEPIQVPVRLSQKELMEITRHNLDVRSDIFKAIRRPGRDFTELFKKLKLLKGCTATKKEVMKCVIEESLRFKRKHLAKLLEEFTATLEKNGSSVLQHAIIKKDYSQAFSENNLNMTMS